MTGPMREPAGTWVVILLAIVGLSVWLLLGCAYRDQATLPNFEKSMALEEIKPRVAGVRIPWSPTDGLFRDPDDGQVITRIEHPDWTYVRIPTEKGED